MAEMPHEDLSLSFEFGVYCRHTAQKSKVDDPQSIVADMREGHTNKLNRKVMLSD